MNCDEILVRRGMHARLIDTKTALAQWDNESNVHVVMAVRPALAYVRFGEVRQLPRHTRKAVCIAFLTVCEHYSNLHQ